MENQDKPKNSDDISINPEFLNKAKSFMKKYWSYSLVILPIIIVILMRYQALGLTITDDWAQNNVYDFYTDSISDQILEQYPNLPEESRQELVRKNVEEFLSQNKDLVEGQIASVSKQQKDFFQYESGEHSYTYMGDIDSYYWLRQARNLDEKGHICDVVENRKCYDTYTLAPLRKELDQSLHPYSIYFTYRIVKPFNKEFTLMQAQLIVPTIYAVIMAVLVYVMMLRSFGLIAALASSLLLSSNLIFLSRSLGSDSDIYNIFFPVLLVFFMLEAFRAKNPKTRAIFAALGGLSLGAYSFAWIGWWYLFDFIIIAIVANYALGILKEGIKSKSLPKNMLNHEKTRQLAYILIPFVVVSVLFIGIVSGFSSLPVALKGPFGFTQTKVAANPDVWPNVLTTVAEFNESSLSSIISQSGGRWFFFFALLGFILLLYGSFRGIKKNFIFFGVSAAIIYYLVSQKGESLQLISYLAILCIPFLFGIYAAFRSEEEIDITFAVLLFLWIASSIYAATKGIRFTLLMATPIALGIGISFWFLHRTLSGLASRAFKINKVFPAIVLFLVLAYPLIEPVKTGFNASKTYIPNVNDQWWDALTKIKDNSKPDAIINSWWDFGHWFKYIADRRVTLDGSSQNNPQLHWLGKLLITSDDGQAKNILRMLDCSGNNAFRAIDKKKASTPLSIKLLNSIIMADREEARELLLQDGFSPEESAKILELTHCQPPENFLITSEDMIGKGAVWAHFGSWNFDKAWVQNAFERAETKEEAVSSFMSGLGISKEQAEQYYSELSGMDSESDINAWIAPWPGYVQGETSCSRQEDAVICPFQQAFVVVNLTTMDAYIPLQGGAARPRAFSYTTPTGINVKEYSDNAVGIGMLLMIRNDGTYTSVFMSPQLLNSTFTKLFYLDGHGTRYFEPFYSSNNNFRIKIWKVNWDDESTLIVDRFNTELS